MINFNRVFAMVLKYTINLRHNFDRLTDMFYWPAMDLLLWGLTGLYFAELYNQSNTIMVILTGVIFWIVIWRAQYEITTNLLSEMWDRNLTNIFASPLKVSEWILAVMIYGFIKMFISISFSAILALVLYKYSVLMFGFYIIPITINLLLLGWAIGFVVAGIIIRYGLRVQTTAWMGVVLIAPFSALYYPVAVLPHWAQTIAKFVPSSYIFEGMREIIYKHTLSFDKIEISFALDVIYLVLSLIFFNFMFKKSRKLGLGRLN